MSPILLARLLTLLAAVAVLSDEPFADLAFDAACE